MGVVRNNENIKYILGSTEMLCDGVNCMEKELRISSLLSFGNSKANHSIKY